MGEARERVEAEREAAVRDREEWAEDVIADVLALERAAMVAVMPDAGLQPSPEQAARIATLHMLAVIRSIGADAGGIADAIEEAGAEDDAEESEESAPEPFSLVATPRRAPE